MHFPSLPSALVARCLLLVVACASAVLGFAEGTKQLNPAVSDTAGLFINGGAYGRFGSVGGPSDTRLQFRLAAPGQEQVFFGFSHGSADDGSDVGVPGAGVDYFFRVVAPDGTVVMNWTAITEATANVAGWAQATTGPGAIAGAPGYPSAYDFIPGSGLVAGDYYVEFSTNNDGTNGDPFMLPYFDITVASRDASPVAYPGRVFSKNWSLLCPPTSNAASSPQGVFDNPFNGQFFVYSDEGFVSKIDFAGAGFQPYIFNMSFNGDGPVSFLSPLENLRSVEGQLRTNPEFDIFLQSPPEALYPSGAYGTMLENADYPKLYGCTGGTEYFVEVAVTAEGIAEVLIDADGADGTFTYNTADRILSQKIVPRAGERAPYVRQIPWDGKDGQGNDVADGADLAARVTFSQVPYHLPVYDAEYMLNGFRVEMVRPAPPADYTFTYQWDDSDITAAAPAGEQKVELEGCATTPTTGCHTWDNFNYGNENTVNTYWYARREAVSVAFNREDPACGCGSTGTLTVGGAVFDDADGSGTPTSGEAGFGGVDVFLYDDANENGVLDADEVLSTEVPVNPIATNPDGTFGFAVNTTGTAGDSDLRTASADADGAEIFQTYYNQFEGFGGYAYTDGDGNPQNAPVTTSLFFTNPGVPRRAEITNAYIQVTGATAQLGRADAATTQIFAEAAPTPTLASTGEVPTRRERTLADVAWSMAAAFTDGTTYTSPSITSVVQELVNRPGYDASGAIHVLATGSGGLNEFRGAEVTPTDATDAPRLVVEYLDFGLPKTFVLAIDETQVPGDKRFVTDTTSAVALYEPAAYNCFNRFGLAADRDGDGVIDARDLDNDNDGIPDADEHDGTGVDPLADADGDDVPNYLDHDGVAAAGGTPAVAFVDINNDGVNDAFDADRDGLPSALDLDADNDGIPDLVEAGGTDVDGDGLVDDATDTDRDGLVDAYDNNDTDGPTGNGLDATTPSTSALVDTDADGTADGPDTDGDGVADYVDLDADNDGITDLTGDGRVDDATDADGDGLADLYDPAHDGPDAAANAAPTAGTALAQADTDGDGLPDHRDIDADGDGLPDLSELAGVDTDGDGRVDNPADADGDGLADVYDPEDDRTLTTADGTGTALVTRDAGGVILDGYAANGGIAQATDLDGDGVANHLDRDSDNDGIADLLEAGADPALDVDQDGRLDATAGSDADGDGLADAYDVDVTDGPGTGGATAGTALATTTADANADGFAVGATERVTGADADGDGFANFRDLDADGDGVTDVVEQNAGSPANDLASGSRDGRANSSGSDFAVNNQYAALDTDGDGVPDYLDVDADNDGIADALEAVCTGCALAPGGVDADRDGVDDTYEGLDDANAAGAGANVGTTPVANAADGDAVPDYLDTDTDGDTFLDYAEGFDATDDDDTDALNDLVAIAAAYESANGAPGHYDAAVDTDGDGIADWIDNLAGPGLDQAATPPYLDPTSPFWRDANGNGMADLVDPFAAGATPTTLPDADGVGDADWRDANTATSLPLTLVSFAASPEACGASLTWVTADERDVRHFEVERAGADGAFVTVATERARNAAGLNRYTAEVTVEPGTHYFRLRSVDVDGASVLSDAVAVTSACEALAPARAYPNPARIGESIVIENLSGATATVTDALGHPVAELRIDNSVGVVRTVDLAPGFYYVIGGAGETQTRIVIR